MPISSECADMVEQALLEKPYGLKQKWKNQKEI